MKLQHQRLRNRCNTLCNTNGNVEILSGGRMHRRHSTRSGALARDVTHMIAVRGMSRRTEQAAAWPRMHACTGDRAAVVQPAVRRRIPRTRPWPTCYRRSTRTTRSRRSTSRRRRTSRSAARRAAPGRSSAGTPLPGPRSEAPSCGPMSAPPLSPPPACSSSNTVRVWRASMSSAADVQCR